MLGSLLDTAQQAGNATGIPAAQPMAQPDSSAPAIVPKDDGTQDGGTGGNTLAQPEDTADGLPDSWQEISKTPEVLIQNKVAAAKAAAAIANNVADYGDVNHVAEAYKSQIAYNQALSDKIDGIQASLQPPPVRTPPVANIGENIASLIGIIANHRNPIAANQMMLEQAGNVKARNDLENTNAANTYEFHRQNALNSLQNLYQQQKAGEAQANEIQLAGIHGQQAQDIANLNNARYIDVAKGKDYISESNKNMGVLETARPEDRAAIMQRQNQLYQLSGGLAGYQFSDQDIANANTPNFDQILKNAKAGEANANAAYTAGAKTQNTQSQIQFRNGPQTQNVEEHTNYYKSQEGEIAIKNKVLEQQANEIGIKSQLDEAHLAGYKLTLAAMPQELADKAKERAANIYKLEQEGQITSKQGVGAVSDYAKLVVGEYNKMPDGTSFGTITNQKQADAKAAMLPSVQDALSKLQLIADKQSAQYGVKIPAKPIFDNTGRMLTDDDLRGQLQAAIKGGKDPNVVNQWAAAWGVK